MAQFKFIQTWEQNGTNSYDDYATYLFCKKANMDKIAYSFINSKGIIIGNPFNLQIAEISDLSRNIKSRLINVDSIFEIHCTKKEISILDLNILNDEQLYDAIRNFDILDAMGNNAKQKALLNSYLKEYRNHNLDNQIDRITIQQEFFFTFETLSYHAVSQANDESNHSFMVMPDDVKEILGNDLFEKLSQNPL